MPSLCHSETSLILVAVSCLLCGGAIGSYVTQAFLARKPR